jgi:3-oxoadipate enol-lactonase
MLIPWLPQGQVRMLPGRGEMFFRLHQHPDPSAPTLVLLHGWTASADLQFFCVYESLAATCSFVAVDHRGHGRSARTAEPFALEDAADDAAALVQLLQGEGVLATDPVTLIGYSMGGPISLLLTRRHPDLVRSVIVQATALEWRAKWYERVQWKTTTIAGPLMRSWAFPRWVRFGVRRMLGENHPFRQYVPWLTSEMRRNDTHDVLAAGNALSAYDARPWASSLGKPAGMLITTKDRLVKPRKQRALAAALGAHVEEIAADHLCTWVNPDEYNAATTKLVVALTS